LALVVALGIARTVKITIKRKEKIIMHVVHIQVEVKPECVAAFKAATIENARQSLREPGIARFDVVQQEDDPTRFVLEEAYRSVEATAAHKETKHYQVWRDTVAPIMAAPRSSVKFEYVFPEDVF
jgi:(4S)-4-hydroxy-5-phosphonooxypentane-2,3-dione isomerase